MRLLHQRLDHDGAALLNENKKPSDEDIKDALTGLKCRCGTHMSIMRAVKRASEMMG